jgi:release factor glutamine methyltransferase
MKSLINHIISELRDFYPEEELRELALWIIEEATGLTRTQIITANTAADIPDINSIIELLQANTPIQYIFGRTQWLGLDLRVTPATLIPRPETAELVDWVISTNDNNAPLRVLDIGTGSGCIAIALKKHCPNWIIQGVDISPEALEVARENSQSNDVNIEWKVMDILSETPDSVDIIVSNPPYICHREKADMHARVLDHEPHTALFVPNDDPLLFYRRIATLKAAPMLFFEINEAYGNEVCEMMAKLGYTDIQLKHDIYGKPRMVFGRIKA